jgi:hypothetical protein
VQALKNIEYLVGISLLEANSIVLHNDLAVPLMPVKTLKLFQPLWIRCSASDLYQGWMTGFGKL